VEFQVEIRVWQDGSLAAERVVYVEGKEAFITELRDFADDIDHGEIDFWPEEKAF
jgi:hypothetical protein